MKKKIYIAGPLFSDAERSANEAMCYILEKWCDVFLPQRDGYLVPNLIARGLSPEEAYRFVFQRDVNAIEASDAIIVNLDGRAVDEGAAFELGVAHALGKLCIGYRTDVRVLLEWGLNPMVVVPLSKIMSTPSELEAWAAEFSQGEALSNPQRRVSS
jgi:nucleoside 2-deoxyribosyltransferase